MKFHPDCIDCVRLAARDIFGDNVREMHAGAGNEILNTSCHCYIPVIIIPSKGGRSRHPVEYSSAEDWLVGIHQNIRRNITDLTIHHSALGAKALLDAVLRYDRKLKAAGV